MKAEHRHELKSNDLAQWLKNLPVWASANYKLLIYVAVVALLVLGASFYHWHVASQRAQSQRLEFTQAVLDFDRAVMNVLQGSMEDQDLSYMILDTNESFDRIARTAQNDTMGAWALIKKGHALRSSLLYRPGQTDAQYAENQLQNAIEAYKQAMPKTPNQTVVATAMLGIGLSYEQLGQFDQAKQAYSDLVEETSLDSTAAYANAQARLEMLEIYAQPVRLAKDTEPVEPLDLDIPQLPEPDAQAAPEMPLEPEMPVDEPLPLP